MKRIIIIVSGSGTNMENLVRRSQSGELPVEVVAVIGDRAGIAAKDRAANLKVPYIEINRKAYENKAAFEKAVTAEIKKAQVDWIVLAGFMRILSDEFVLHFWGRIINIHPSYLPAFPGADGLGDAFRAGVAETGVTVHFVDLGVDTGKVILQKKVTICDGDTLEALETRVHAMEYEIYPAALQMLIRSEVTPPAKPVS